MSTFITMFILFLNILTSTGEADGYKSCSSSASCGSVDNIGYPFWGDDLRPQECRTRNQVFRLKCPSSNNSITGDYPLVQIIDEYDEQYHQPSYQVLGINLSTNTIKLQAQYPQFSNCSIPLHQPVFSGRPLEYSPSVEVIYLLECNHSIRHHPSKSISCLNHRTNVILRYYFPQHLPDDIQKSKSHEAL